MKFLILFFLLYLTSCSEYTKLEGVYYSNRQDCFVLDDKNGSFESKDGSIWEDLSLNQTKNKLKFRWITYSTRGLFRKHIDKYFFKFIYKGYDSFMISPISKLAKDYYHGRDSIVFKTKFFFADPTNYFTKIIFHSGRCFGNCDDLHLELDYSGNLKVTNNGNGITDTARNDNYYGKVSPEDLEKLNKVLKYSQLKTLVWPDRRCYDLPDFTLILYQHDICYYFKINSACLPIVSHELTGFLYRLFGYKTLKKVDTTFTYER